VRQRRARQRGAEEAALRRLRQQRPTQQRVQPVRNRRLRHGRARQRAQRYARSGRLRRKVQARVVVAEVDGVISAGPACTHRGGKV
jgi:hypothetical protein